MITVKICPSCKHENSEDASYCTQCGMALVGGSMDVITRPVSEEELTHLTEEPAPKTGTVANVGHDSSIALFIGGSEQPLLLRRQPEISLGRQVEPGLTPPIIDPGVAAEYGVSRNHATINFADGVYTVKDLGSTNGTFLNGKRLLDQLPYVLQSGDQIRLGMLVIYIYFKT